MKVLIGDIGNTLIKLSVVNNNYKIIKSYSFETKKIQNQLFLKNLFKKILKNKLRKNILFSSVVPKAYKKIRTHLIKHNYKVHEIKDLKISRIIKLKVDNYKQLGSDRIANAIGAFYNYKTNCLVIDFGTATTFDIVKKPGIYEGGVIAPGVKLSIYNLNLNTASLPIFKLRKTSKIYGKNTKDALNAGFLWGYQGLIDNITQKITKKLQNNFKIILTGGYANIFLRFLTKKASIDNNITVKGIIYIYKKLIK